MSATAVQASRALPAGDLNVMHLAGKHQAVVGEWAQESGVPDEHPKRVPLPMA